MKNRFLTAFAALLVFAAGCQDENTGNPGEVLANSHKVVSGQYHTATMSAEVYGDGITDRGICWATSQLPTLEDSSVSDGKGGTGKFTLELTGLTAGTNYYARSYATGADGKTSYGSPMAFSTTAYLSATVNSTTPDLTDITVVSTIANGLADLVVTERGVVYGTTATPETGGTKLKAEAGGKGQYTVKITGLEMATKYYVKAYAVSSEGTIYSAAKEVTTLTPTPVLFRTSLEAAGLKWGVVRDADTKFVAHYTFAIDDSDKTKSKVTITYIEPDGDKDAKHVTLPVTFNDDYTTATWDAVSNDGSEITGMNRSGTTFTVSGTAGLTLDTPMPTSEIKTMFVSGDNGGLGRVSESLSGQWHSTIGAMWSGDNRVGLIEINGGFDALMTRWNEPGYEDWMCYSFDGNPVISGDIATFAFAGSYFWGDNNPDRLALAWGVIGPFRNVLFNSKGSYIVKEFKDGKTADAGDFNYYMIRTDGVEWYKWYLRKK